MTQASLLTVAQVAEELGITPEAVFKYVWAGRLRALDLNNGLKRADGIAKRRHLRVRRRDLEEFLRGCEVKEGREG